MSLPQTRYYQRARIETASQKQLILMAYDRIVADMEEAKEAFDAKRLEDANWALQHAQQIVNVLREALDAQHPQVEMLVSFYLFLKKKLIQANVEADPAILQELLPVVVQVRESWKAGFKHRGAQKPTVPKDVKPDERQPLSVEL